MSQKINFEKATVFVRKYEIVKKPVRVWKTHRGTAIKLWKGYIIIERAWYPK